MVFAIVWHKSRLYGLICKNGYRYREYIARPSVIQQPPSTSNMTFAQMRDGISKCGAGT